MKPAEDIPQNNSSTGRSRQSTKTCFAGWGSVCSKLSFDGECNQSQALQQDSATSKIRTVKSRSGDNLITHHWDHYDSSPFGYVTLDANGIILNGNRAAAALLGFKRENSLRSKRFDQFIAPQSRAASPLSRCFPRTADPTQTLGLVLRRRDGSEFFAGLEICGAKESERRQPSRLVAFQKLGRFAEIKSVPDSSKTELATIYENLPLIMLLVDEEGRIHKTNKFAETFAGGDARQLLGLKVGDALHCVWASRAPDGCGSGPRCQNCTLLSIANDTLKTGRQYHRVETEIVFSDGERKRPLTMLLSSARTNTHRKPYALITLENITERKNAEQRIAQLNRIYATLWGVDRAIVHNTNQRKLLNAICKIAVEKGGFKLAWVGIVNDRGVVRPVASAGKTGYLKNIRVVVGDEPSGRGPAGEAIRNNRSFVIDNVANDQRMKPWQARAKKYGLNYVAVFPLRIAGKVIGAIGLYAPHANFFSKEEVRLLSLISDEISFALTAIHVSARRKEAVEALLQSQKELADFVDHSPAGILWVGADGKIFRVNQAELKLLDRMAGDVLGKPIQAFHDDPDVIAEVLERLAAGQSVTNCRARIRQKNGKIKHVIISANGLWSKKRLRHSRWFVWNITPRVELELEILTIGERLQRELGQNLHDDLAQQLASIEFLSQALAADLAPHSQAVAVQARDIASLSQIASSKVRKLSHGLFPIGIEHDGLHFALQELAESTRQIFRTNIRFRGKPPPSWISESASIHLYRIAQEAVNNAIKHGKARQVDIILAASNQSLVLAIQNDGLSFPANPASGRGIGLRLMQYRASVIGGSLTLETRPNGKMSVTCTLLKRRQIPLGGATK